MVRGRRGRTPGLTPEALLLYTAPHFHSVCPGLLMENTTQLLLRQVDALSGRQVLVVDANDPALKRLDVEADIHLHADDFTIGAQQWAAAPTVPR